MKLGVNLLNFGPGANPRDLLRWAQLAEEFGYDSVMISDHVAITPDVAERYPEPYFDAFATLAWLAGQTTRVRLGTTVAVLPYRHPVLVARLGANIDQLSGGRFVFGVGVGNSLAEFAAMGAAHQHRGAVSNETLDAVIALWTAESSVSYHGRFIHFDDVAAIAPAQVPHPEVWVGGSSEAALQRTLRYGDAWHPILRTLGGFDESATVLRAFAASSGDGAPLYCPRIRLDIRDDDLPAERAPGAGSVAQVQADLARLEALGAAHVTLDWFTGDVGMTREHERGWQMLELVATTIVDLGLGSVR